MASGTTSTDVRSTVSGKSTGVVVPAEQTSELVSEVSCPSNSDPSALALDGQADVGREEESTDGRVRPKVAASRPKRAARVLGGSRRAVRTSTATHAAVTVVAPSAPGIVGASETAGTVIAPLVPAETEVSAAPVTVVAPLSPLRTDEPGAMVTATVPSPPPPSTPSVSQPMLTVSAGSEASAPSRPSTADMDGAAPVPRSTAAKVLLLSDVMVPAGVELVVAGFLGAPIMNDPSEVYLVETDRGRELPTGLGLARVIVTRGEAGIIPLRIYNGGEKDKRLSAGRVVARAEPVRVVDDTNGEGTVAALQESAGTPSLTPDLEELWRVAQADPTLSEQGASALRELLCKHTSVFASSDSDLGRAHSVTHDIRTTTEQPLWQPPRKSSPLKEETERKLVKDMEAKGIIEPSVSRWASPTVLVQKKDGSVRFCVDYRRLNDLTIKDAFPLPRIDETLDSLGGAVWFSTLDLLSGYWQVALTDDAKEKSAFCTKSGRFQWRVMPFGLCNAPATFERLMETVLRGLHWESCLVYLDDVIVFGKDERQMLSRLDVVFGRLAGAGLKLKPTKCKLFLKEVEYLGHVISAEGVRVDPKKIETIRAWETPRTITEVRSFLGLASYYRRFVEHFAAVAAPLHAVTGAATVLLWGAEQQAAFEELRRRLSETQILAFPDVTADVILSPDYEGPGLGATVSQQTATGERVVAYASNVMNPSQRKYCTTKKGLLALVTALRHFRPLLAGRKVIVRTDRWTLEWLRALQDPPGLLARWSETLAEYELVVEDRPSERHDVGGIRREECPQCVANKTTVLNEERVRRIAVEPDRPQWPELSTERWRAAQLNDLAIRDVLRAQEESGELSQKERRRLPKMGHHLVQNWSHLLVRNGVLHLIEEVPEIAPGMVRSRIVIPARLRGDFLNAVHQAAHLNRWDAKTMTRKLREAGWWYRMHADVETKRRRCPQCQVRDRPRRGTAGTSGTMPQGIPGVTVQAPSASGPHETAGTPSTVRPVATVHTAPAKQTGTVTVDVTARMDTEMAPLPDVVDAVAQALRRSSEQLRQCQVEDAVLGWVLRAVESGVRPAGVETAQRGREARRYIAKWTQLGTQHSVLCAREDHPSGGWRIKVVLPRRLRFATMKHARGRIRAGERTGTVYDLLSETVVWWNMNARIEKDRMEVQPRAFLPECLKNDE